MSRLFTLLVLLISCTLNLYSQKQEFSCDVINHKDNIILNNLSGSFGLTTDDEDTPCILTEVNGSKKGSLAFGFWTDLENVPTLRYSSRIPQSNQSTEKRDIYWFINSDDEVLILYTEYNNGVVGNIVMTQIYNDVPIATCKIHTSDHIRTMIYRIIDKAKRTINFNFE